MNSELNRAIALVSEHSPRQFYWSGRGETNRRDLEYQLAKGGYPISWSPRQQTPRHYLGKAMDTLRSEYTVKNESGESISKATKTYTTRWFVGVAQFSVDDDRFGSKDCMVTLRKTGELEFEGNPATAKAIQEEYNRTVENEIFKSDVMQAWLKDIMKGQFNAMKYGPNYVVPQEHAEEAERFLTVISEIWGCEWLLPGIPQAQTAQLKEALAKSLVTEIEERLQKVSDTAGHRAKQSYLKDLKSLVERAKGYQAIIGSENLNRVAQAAKKTVDELQNGMTATEIRGGLIWEELENYG